MNEQVFEKVDDYINGLFFDNDPALTYATENIIKNGIEDASISPVQGQLLQVFAKACNARKILEVGTLGGYSTIWLAKALPDDGKVITIEYDAFHAQVAKQNIDHAQLGKKVEIKVGKALDILPTLGTEAPFDLIFIDADKPPYTEYFQLALTLSRKGTIIICDNVIRNGKVLDEQSTDEKVKGVQRLNTFLSTCKEVKATILQTVGSKEYDGMVIAIVQ
ncbi:MAG: O-methyltransferase [Bacteroidota bacterium]